MNGCSYISYSNEQLSKIGNTALYLSEKIPQLSKTKLLKLLYILDELSIKKSGIPFLNLQYKVWKFGPVAEDLFIDLSSEISLLKNYIALQHDANGANTLVPVAAFDDDEFSDNDISHMDFVIEKFGTQSAKELVAYTHRKNSPWYNTALEHAVLDLLLSEKINHTQLVIDLAQLVAHDDRKTSTYLSYIEAHS
jgi:uncharacterized phage-associated protein